MPGLDDLYREVILDHYKNPRNQGELPPPAVRSDGYNPLCGDRIAVTMLVEDNVVTNIALKGEGCSISQSSASMMSAAVKGKSVEDARQLIWQFKDLMSIHEQKLDNSADADVASEPGARLGDLEALQGVVKFPVRIKCATLAWNTLEQGLDQTEAKG
jgi:nitrogen fixation protein NifU and related proteins